MRNFLLFLTLITIFWISCDNPVTEEKDTTPPVIYSVLVNKENPVDQILEIYCTTEDNIGISKVELWINSSHYNDMEDTEFPYLFELNTSENDSDGNPIFQQNIIYNIQLKVIDNSGNATFSDPPIQIEVDNSNSAPDVPQITSVNYSDGKNIIQWTKNTEEDFKEYILKKRDLSNSPNWFTILVTDDSNIITYEDVDIDPFSTVEYFVRVYDNFGYYSTSAIVSSPMEGVPESVDVTSITYSNEEMTVSWEMSTADDFANYILFHWNEYNESEEYDTIAIYNNKNVVSHSLNFDLNNNFTPIIENWFKVMVTDTFNLSSIGMPLSSEIDLPPLPIEIDSIHLNSYSYLQVYWDEPIDNDIIQYEIVKNSNGIHYSMNEYTYCGEYNFSPGVTYCSFENSINCVGDGDENCPWDVAYINNFYIDEFIAPTPDLENSNTLDLYVWDYWGRSTINNQPFEIHNPINSTPEILNIEFDPQNIQITWTSNNEFDFKYYTIYHSFNPDFSTANEIVEIQNNIDTVYSLPMGPTYDFNEDNYFWVEITDYWNAKALSNEAHLFEYQGYSRPDPVNLYSPYYTANNQFYLKWEQSNNNDFDFYSILKADNEDMINAEILITHSTFSQTTSNSYIPDENEQNNYYQILITDQYEMSAESNVIRNWRQDFEFIPINQGEFTYGVSGEIVDLSYFEILKYPVATIQFLDYLRDNLESFIFTYDDNSWVISSYFNHEVPNEVFGVLVDYFNLNESRLIYDGNDFVVELGYEDHPITGVTWYGSYDFAVKQEANLPSDQQWEKAARGSLGYNYPWEEGISGGRANFLDSNDPWDNSTTPIGFFNGQNYNGFQTIDSPSIFGVYDLVGNVTEWTEIYNGSGQYYIKGGSYNDPISSEDLKSWQHELRYPNDNRNDLGFRIVKN